MLIGKLLSFLGYTNSSPANGDLWNDGTDFKTYTNGAARNLTASQTPHGVLIGNGKAEPNVTAAGTAGQVLVSGGAGADPAFSSSFIGCCTAKIKTADETVNGSASLQNDNDLSFSIGANETWQFTLMFKMTTASTPGFKWLFTVPSGATARGNANVTTGTTGIYGLSSADIDLTTGGGSTGAGSANNLYIVSGYVANSSTPGTVRLQWAQQTSNASDTIVKRGSTLTAIRVS